MDKTLLTCSLECAVPLWILQLQQQPWSYIAQRAKECSQIVAEKGDIILFRSGKKGETAKAFNALAEGVACLAFVPGGVTLFGCHWQAEHPEAKRDTEIKMNLSLFAEEPL